MRFDISAFEELKQEQSILTALELYQKPKTKQDFDSLLFYKAKFINVCIDQTSSFELNREADNLLQLGQQDERFLILADNVLAQSLASKKIIQNYVNRLEVLIALDRYQEANVLAEELMEHALLNETKIRQEQARSFLDQVNQSITNT